MEIGQGKNRGGSPLLHELRRWERRSRRAELPSRARLAMWQQAVAIAQSDGDPEAPKLAASLRTILRMGVDSRLAGLEQLVDARRPLSSIVLAPREAAAMRADLDVAAGLGGRVRRHRAELATLLKAQIAAHLLWLENQANAASPEWAATLLPRATNLWGDLLEAEAQGTLEMAVLRQRLGSLQHALETLKRMTSSTREDLADLAPDVFILASQSESLGNAVLKAWTERLAMQFADRPGWEEFVAELRSLAQGEAGMTNEASIPAPIGDRAGHTLLPAALAGVLSFVRDQDERTAAFLAELASARRTEGGHPTLDMPFVTKTEIQLDWVEGQPNPWSSAEVLDQARTAANTLLAEGVRVQFVPGRPLPREEYDERLARRAVEFSLPGPAGRLTLERLETLEKATLVVQSPGRLEVVLPPARTVMSGQVRAGTFAREIVRAVAGLAPAANIPGASAPPINVPGGSGPAARASDGSAPPVELRLDWVEGQDPWHQPDVLARAEAAATQMAGQGVQLVFIRGHGVPLSRYVAGQEHVAADFVVSGSRGPVSLAGLEILERAQPIEQRPGLLHVILAPNSGKEMRTGGPSAENIQGKPAGEVEPYWAPRERHLLASAATQGMGEPQTARLEPGRSAAPNVRPALGRSESGKYSHAERSEAAPHTRRSFAIAQDDTYRQRFGGVLSGSMSPAGALSRHRDLYVGSMPMGMSTRLDNYLDGPRPLKGATTLDAVGAASRSAIAANVTGPFGPPDKEAGGKGVAASAAVPQDVRLELDWIAGQDPWQRPLALAAARQAAGDLEGRGVHLEFIRGRGLPPERYVADEALSAGALGLIGSAGPISLANLTLLDRAMLLAQRPGLLHVILAPASRPGVGSRLPGRIGMASGLTGAIPTSRLLKPRAETGSVGDLSDLRSAPTAAAESHTGPSLELPHRPSRGTAANAASSWQSWQGGIPEVARWATAGGLPGLMPIDRPWGAGPSAEMSSMLSQTFTSGTATPGPGTQPPTGQDWVLPLARQTGLERLAAAESNRPSASAAPASPAQPSVATSTTSGVLDGHGGERAPRMDVDALSRQIYAIIKQRLAVERERSGARVSRLW